MKYQRENNILKRLMGEEFLQAMIDCNGFLAGGSVRSVFCSESIKDFDIFFRKEEDFKKFTDSFDISEVVFSATDTAWSHASNDGYCYQAICAVYGEPTDIIKNFDFTCCMAAWEPDKGFVADTSFFEHCAQRRLVFNANAQFPICSLWRANKFIKRGWKLHAIEAIKLALCINNIDLSDNKTLKRHLLGIDTLFLKELTDSLAKDGDKEYKYLDAIEYISKFFDQDEVPE